jgi:hypothetical protein
MKLTEDMREGFKTMLLGSAFLVCFFWFLIGLAAIAGATGAWYSTAYTSRNIITIAGTTAALTNYQCPITVPYTTGMNANFTDIRFTKSDSVTPLNFCLTSCVPSVSAIFNVQVNVPVSPGVDTIFCYYHNPSATVSKSNFSHMTYSDSTITTTAAYGIRAGDVDLVYNGLMWVMGGYTLPIPSAKLNDVWYSSDGKNWTQATAHANWKARAWATGIVYNGLMWVMGGDTETVGNTTFAADVWYSSDGITWVDANSTAPWISKHAAFGCVYNNKMWLMGGENTGGVYTNNIAWTVNGVDWTVITAPGWSARQQAGCFSYNGKMWVVGGYNGGGVVSDAWNTSDGLAWTQVSTKLPFGIRYGATGSAIYDSLIWVMGGGLQNSSAAPYTADAWYSADGSNWNKMSGTPSWSPRIFSHLLPYNSKLYLIGGLDDVGGTPTLKSDVYYVLQSHPNPPPVVTIGVQDTIVSYSGINTFNSNNTILQKVRVVPAHILSGISDFIYKIYVPNISHSFFAQARTDSSDIQVFDTLGDRLPDTLRYPWIYVGASASSSVNNSFQIECGSGRKASYGGKSVFSFANCAIYSPCNDASGTISDLAGNYPGTATSVSYGTSGLNGNSIYYSTTSSNISFGNVTKIDSIRNLSFMYLINPDHQPAQTWGNSWWKNNYPTSYQWSRDAYNFATNLNTPSIFSGAQGIVQFTPTITRTDSQWHQYVLCYDGAQRLGPYQAAAYVDSTAQTVSMNGAYTSLSTFTAKMTSDPLTFGGAYLSLTYSILGHVQNLAVFTRTLSAAEASAYWQNQSAPTTFFNLDSATCFLIITVQPVSQSVAKGGTLNLSITATSPTTPSYQWKKNGSNVGTNSSSYSESNMQAGASYTCVVSNDCGTVTSNAAVISVAAPAHHNCGRMDLGIHMGL